MPARSVLLAASLVAVSGLAGCGHDAPTAAETTQSAGELAAGRPPVPGAASTRLFYKVKLAPSPGFAARGMLLIEVVGGHLTARLHANGVEPGQNIPQHIHTLDNCSSPSPVLINLDAGLTVPGESPPIGLAYPFANPGGVVQYEASRSLTDLMAALNQHVGTTLTTTGELLAYLDLENRNAHMHVPFPTFPAVNCGPVEPVN